ncbi:MAG: hypothetical protein AAGB13_12690 [Cyanobacteria bacterium P01_F01_bin.33]
MFLLDRYLMQTKAVLIRWLSTVARIASLAKRTNEQQAKATAIAEDIALRQLKEPQNRDVKAVNREVSS